MKPKIYLGVSGGNSKKTDNRITSACAWHVIININDIQSCLRKMTISVIKTAINMGPQ